MIYKKIKKYLKKKKRQQKQRADKLKIEKKIKQEEELRLEKRDKEWKNEYLEKEYDSYIEKNKRLDRRYICDKCEYKWESKKRFGEPSVCPHCRERFIFKYSSTDKWKDEQLSLKEFEENLHDSKSAQAKSLSFDTKIIEIECSNCSHKNQVNIEDIPKKGEQLNYVCAECEGKSVLSLPDESYECPFCENNHSSLSDRLKHIKNCKERLRNAIQCNKCKADLTLDEDEIIELEKNGTLEIVCPSCPNKNKFNVKRENNKLKRIKKSV